LLLRAECLDRVEFGGGVGGYQSGNRADHKSTEADNGDILRNHLRRDFVELVDVRRERVESERFTEEIPELVPPSDDAHSGGQPREVAKNSDDHPLHKEDPDDLAAGCSESLENANFAGFLNGNGDEGVHHTERGHDDDEKEQEKHDIPFHADGVKDLPVEFDPCPDENRGLDLGCEGVEAFPDEVRVIRVVAADADPVDPVLEPVEFLADVQGDEDKLRIVHEASGFKNTGNGEFLGQYHRFQVCEGLFVGGILLGAVQFIDDFADVARGEDGDPVAHHHTEFSGEGGAKERLVTVEVECADLDGAADIADANLAFGIDSADLRGEPAALEFDENRALDEGGGCHDARGFADRFFQRTPAFEVGVGENHEMRVESEDLFAQLVVEPGHYREHDDEHRDAERHPENRDQGDGGHKGALRFEIAQCEEEAEGRFHGKRTSTDTGGLFGTKQNPWIIRLTGGKKTCWMMGIFMNRAFSLLLMFVLFHTQAWAISGDPVFPQSFSYVGTYAGVVIPDTSDIPTFSSGTAAAGTSGTSGGTGLPGSGSTSSTGSSTAATDGVTSLTETEAEQLGLFGFAQGATGFATGVIAMFASGTIFIGTMEAVINPKNGVLKGVIAAAAGNTVDGDDYMSGFGTIKARIRNLDQNSVPGTLTAAEVEGTAILRLYDPSEDGTISAQRSTGLKYKVEGFQQSVTVAAPSLPITTF
jgi:hypothetical protein